jgi:hypothetical protein
MQPDRDAVIQIGVEMDFSQCPMGMWERVRFECPQCQSITYNENGTSKCRQCGYGNRVCNLKPIFNVIDEPPLEGPSDLAIVSVAVGQRAFELLEITRPMLERYAAKCGADLHVITDDAYQAYPLANKFRLAWLTANYKRVLFVDNDVWIRDSAPSIFDTFTKGSIWMHPDADYHEPSVEYAEREMLKLCESQQLPRFNSRMLNTGVVLFDREHVAMWTPPKLPMAVRHIVEQIAVESNIVIGNMPQRDLPEQWNWQFYFKDFAKKEPSAHIIHLAACSHDERVYRMRKYDASSI